MKRRITMFFIIIFAFVFLLAGCKKTEPLTDYNALGGWTKDVSDVYTLTKNTDSELSFTYDKADKPNAVLTKAIDKDLSDLKKLVITVQGTGSMLLRLEDDTNKVKMVSLQVPSNKSSYEWNLLDEAAFLKKLKKISLIAAPGKEDSVGDIKITELKFYNTIADNYIIQTGYNDIPDNVNEYNGTDEVFHFNAKWEDNGDEVYTITKDGTDVVVSFDNNVEWSAMITRVQGNFAKFDYVVAEVSGTAGQQLLLKAANGFESRVKFDGTKQEVAVDISSMSDIQKNAIKEILIFGQPGVAGSSGNFVIHDIYFTEEYTMPVEEIIYNVYDGISETFTIKNWYDGGDLAYTSTKSGTDTILAYDKESEWAFAASYIQGDISEFGALEFVITGQENKTAMFKIEGGGGAIELNATFDATKQTFVMKLNAMTKEQLEAVNKVLIFALPGGKGSGQMTIHSVTFAEDVLDLNEGWIDNSGDDLYTFTKEAGIVTINYERTNAQVWEFIKLEFTEDLSSYNVLEMIVKGEAGKQIIIKPNDDGAYEKTITFDGTNQTVTFELDNVLERILIFVDPLEGSLTGSFEIHAVTMTYVQPPLVEPRVDVNDGWADNGDDVYTITETEDGVIKVDYTKDTGHEWATMKKVIEPKHAGYNVFEIHLRGTPGIEVLVKVNNAIEKWVTFAEDGKAVAIIKANTISDVLIFAEGGNTSVNGTFYIDKAYLNLVKDITDWVDNGDDVYTFAEGEDGAIIVDYVKDAGNEWSTAKVVFSSEDAMFNTFTIYLTGTVDKKVLVKINDTLEKWVTFDEEGNGSVSVILDRFYNILLFAEGGDAPATGQFTIVSATLGYSAPDIMTSISVNEGWVDNGDNVYTITEGIFDTTVDYVKGVGQEWSAMKQVFSGDQLGYNTYTINLEGTAGKQVLVKVNDAIEQWVTFDEDGKATARISATPVLSAFLFAEGGTDDVSGSFKIISVVLSLEIDANKNWADNGDGSNTITKDGSKIVVDYNKTAGQEWTTLLQTFKGDYAVYNTFTIYLTGTATKQVLVKVNNAIEKWVTFDDDGKGSAVIYADNIVSVHLFAEGGFAPVTGQYIIQSATLSYTELEVKEDLDINDVNWTDDDSVYTFTENVDGSIKVDYDKGPDDGWSNMNKIFGEEALGYTTVKITMTGTADKKVLVKVNNAIEVWVTFDGDGNGSATVTASAIQSLHLFAEGGEVDTTGSFTIVSAVLSQNE